MTPADLEQILNSVVNADANSPSQAITLSEQDLDRSLDELEVDSLAKAEMLAVLDDKYRIAVKDEDAAGFNTPRDVLDFVTRQSRQGVL
ncbi:phosphopantetheine-binding protein [Actinophytocola glycyrrhizae]|uniref:Phosphopantetheine-binding protein n=1 Tax=Actinophytocola glycyrrhizae TaxID=2044873 RepID=A0ABV9SB86_9PSEU